MDKPKTLDDWAKLKAKLQSTKEGTRLDFPPIVDWNETPEIMGTVEKIRPVTTVFGESVICDLKTPDGKLVSFWLTTVLRSQFERLKIQEGYRIGVKCLGKKKRYFDFAVITI